MRVDYYFFLILKTQMVLSISNIMYPDFFIERYILNIYYTPIHIYFTSVRRALCIIYCPWSCLLFLYVDICIVSNHLLLEILYICVSAGHKWIKLHVSMIYSLYISDRMGFFHKSSTLCWCYWLMAWILSKYYSAMLEETFSQLSRKAQESTQEKSTC